MDPITIMIISAALAAAIFFGLRGRPATDPAGDARAMREAFGSPEPPRSAGRAAVQGGNLAYDNRGRLVGWQRYAPASAGRRPAAVATATANGGAGAAGPAGAPGAAAAALTLTLTLTGVITAVAAAGGTNAVYTLVATGVATGTPVTVTFTGLPAGVTASIIGAGGVPLAAGAPLMAGTGYLVNLVPAGAATGTYHFTIAGAGAGLTATANGTLTLT